jgi:hypothetical protein
MAFFDRGSSQSLYVTKDIWLYPVVAIPFTLLVIFVWIWWRRREVKSALKLRHTMDLNYPEEFTNPRVENQPIVPAPSPSPRLETHDLEFTSETKSLEDPGAKSEQSSAFTDF